MKRIIALLAACVALPVYAADPATAQQPAAAAAQPTAAPAATPAQPAAAAPQSTGTVARAQFTSAVENREPVDKVSSLLNDKNRVYFFSEIKDAPNQKITHRWEYNGKVMSEMNFDIGSERWRVFSSKNLDPSWTGEWKVSVLDQTGSTLGASTFTYEKAAAAAANPPASAPATTAPAAADPQKP